MYRLTLVLLGTMPPIAAAAQEAYQPPATVVAESLPVIPRDLAD